MNVLSLPTLILDKGHRPIEISNVRESICDILEEKAMSVLDRSYEIHSPRLSIRVPSVIVKFGSIFTVTAHWSKLNVIYRDDMQCQYCGKRFTDNIKKLNVDHIIPKTRFNEFLKDRNLQLKFLRETGLSSIPKRKNDWLNTVCTCTKCNSKKKNRFIWDNGYRLMRAPFVPKYTPRIILSAERADKFEWMPYLEKFNGVNVRLN